MPISLDGPGNHSGLRREEEVQYRHTKKVKVKIEEVEFFFLQFWVFFRLNSFSFKKR